MVAYTYQMPSGIPGAITRPEQSTVEQGIANQTTPPTIPGQCVINVSGQLEPVQASSLSADIIGFLVREYPTSGNGTDGLGVSTPSKALPMSYLKRGYISVSIETSQTAPVKQGKVYVRVADTGTGKVVGDILTAGDVGVTASAFTGTGTQTIGTLSALPSTPALVYKVTLTATGATAAFNVTDPDGALIGAGNIGTQFTADNGLSFLVTTGGTPTTGDHATVTVAQNAVQVPGNTYFTGAMDASNNAEVAFNI